MLIEALIFGAVWWAIGFLFMLWMGWEGRYKLIWRDLAICAIFGGATGPLLAIIVCLAVIAACLKDAVFWSRPVFKKRTST